VEQQAETPVIGQSPKKKGKASRIGRREMADATTGQQRPAMRTTGDRKIRPAFNAFTKLSCQRAAAPYDARLLMRGRN